MGLSLGCKRGRKGKRKERKGGGDDIDEVYRISSID